MNMREMDTRARISLIETDCDFRRLYCHLLNNQRKYHLVGIYEDIDVGLDNLFTDKPDVFMIGLESLYYDRVDFRKISKKAMDTEIVLITDSVDSQVMKAIEYGISAFLLRISPLHEIEEAINTVLQGGGFLNGIFARKLVESFQKSYSSPLTYRESEVLKCLSDGKTYTMIANDLSISSGTVKTHLKSIYHKLHVSTKADAIRKYRKIRVLN